MSFNCDYLKKKKLDLNLQKEQNRKLHTLRTVTQREWNHSQIKFKSRTFDQQELQLESSVVQQIVCDSVFVLWTELGNKNHGTVYDTADIESDSKHAR